jgi:hypothetical protein
MAIRHSTHATRQIAARQLQLEWIEETVLNPDWTMADPDPTLTRSYKAIAERGGRVLRVAHRPDGADVLVVTAFFDRGARR